MDPADPLPRLRRLFAYDAWANRETLASLERAGPARPAEAVRLLAHVVGTGWLWWARLLRQPSPLAVWPDLGLADLPAQIDRLDEAWAGLLDEIAADPSRLAEEIPYVNSLGESWVNRAGDLLEHAVLHGVYHRGQIAAALRRAGCEPASTDFVHAVRRGLVA